MFPISKDQLCVDLLTVLTTKLRQLKVIFKPKFKFVYRTVIRDNTIQNCINEIKILHKTSIIICILLSSSNLKFDFEKYLNKNIMSFSSMINPASFLNKCLGRPIICRLKWNQMEYKGILMSLDGYMNIQLARAKEFIDGKYTATLGEIMIRSNSILYIRECTEDEDLREEDNKD